MWGEASRTPPRKTDAAHPSLREPGLASRQPQPFFVSSPTLGPEYLLAGGSDFYDIASDDEQFLMRRSTGEVVSGVGQGFILVQNFFEELRQVVPD